MFQNVTPCYDFNAYKQPSSTGANFYQHHQGWSHKNRTHTPERHLNLRHGFDECDHIQVDNPDLCDGPSSLSLTLKSFEAHEIPQSSSKSCIDAGTSSWKSKEKLSVSPPIQLVSRGPIASPKDNRKPTSAVLKCPGCFKTFAQEDHILLLEHLEVCTLWALCWRSRQFLGWFYSFPISSTPNTSYHKYICLFFSIFWYFFSCET